MKKKQPRPSAKPDPRAAARAIRPGMPRRAVQAYLPDGRIFAAPPGTPLDQVLRVARGRSSMPVVAAIVNGRLRELSDTLNADAEIQPLTPLDAEGMRIYRRSLAFLMVTAAAELYPSTAIYIEHSASTSGAFYCEARNGRPFTPKELQAIEGRMRQIVSADAPIRSVRIAVPEAMQVLESRGESDKARLLAHLQREWILMHELCGRRDHISGYLASSAGGLRSFALHPFPPGFLLQFPHLNRPGDLPPVRPYPRLFAVFEEAGNWLNRLGIRSAGTLNDVIADGRLPEISLVAEALHEARLAQIAAEIAAHRDRIRVVLIAGPSSSGKTTFSKRLAVQLLASGLRPYPISLDDYFVERDKTPRDEHNKPNYETIQALDLGLFNENLAALVEGRTVALPRYNFKTGCRDAGPSITLGREHIVIVEGIHGLNPQLIQGLQHDRLYRVYVSALTQLNMDRHNRIHTTDCRLIRRIVRDAAFRGKNAATTLDGWGSVIAGEKQNIFPYQENSDAIFNSALVHELAILRPLADPLLLQVRADSPNSLEANRLLALLQWFRPASPEPVPSNSILREFIGGSILENFNLWPYR